MKVSKGKSLKTGHKRTWEKFILALKELSVGDSIQVPKHIRSNFRTAISVVQILLGVQFTTRNPERVQFRLTRIA